jgi:transposase
MKELQNGRLVRFSKKTDCWCAFNLNISNKKGPVCFCVSRAAVSKVMTAYTNHGETSSAKKNSGRKPKLSERDCRTLTIIVSKNRRNAAAKVTAELNIHHDDTVSIKTVQRELHKSNINGRAAIAKYLITDTKAKGRKRWCDVHKTWTVDYCKYTIWPNGSPSLCSQHQDGLCLKNVQGNLKS